MLRTLLTCYCLSSHQASRKLIVRMTVICVLLGLFVLTTAEVYKNEHGNKYDLPEYNRDEFEKSFEDLGVAFTRGRDKFNFSGPHPSENTKYAQKKCQSLTYFASRKEHCPNAGYGSGYRGGDNCYDDRCNYWAVFGSTKCFRKVKLWKSHWHGGVECEWPGKSCDYRNDGSSYRNGVGDRGYGYAGHKNGPGPSDSDNNNCICQTIWCLKKIYTVYEHYGRFSKGHVTIKVPCKCDCRSKKYYG